MCRQWRHSSAASLHSFNRCCCWRLVHYFTSMRPTGGMDGDSLHWPRSKDNMWGVAVAVGARCPESSTNEWSMKTTAPSHESTIIRCRSKVQCRKRATFSDNPTVAFSAWASTRIRNHNGANSLV